MGVYIKGMEMPEEGQIVLVEIDENGDVFAAYDGGRTKLTQYKAVSVPSHGRLIDADKAILKIREDMKSPSTLGNSQYFVNELREMPTIVEAEE